MAEDSLPIVNESLNGSDVTHSTVTLRFKSVLKAISGVEIPMFAYFLALGILLPAQLHFLNQRICLYKFDSQAICEKIDKDPALIEMENELQKDYSMYSTLQMVFLYLPATIATIFMGSWVDRFSFKIPLLIPHLGTALGTIIYLFYYFIPHNLTHPAVLSLPHLVYGFTGASPTEIMAAFAYVSRISTVESRSVRVAIVEATIGLGTTSGSLLSAWALGKSNTFLSFAVQICLSFYTCIFVFFIVPEIHRDNFRTIANREAGGSLFKLFFHPGKKILNGVKIVSRRFNAPLSNGLDRYIFLLVILLGICFFTSNGTGNVSFAYLTKQPISLSRSDYAIYQGLLSGLSSFNLLVTLRVLRMRWFTMEPFSDVSLIIMGILSRTAGYTLMGFADFFPLYAPWLYSAVVMLSGFFAASLRSLLSKLVFHSEKGALFSLIGVMEGLTGILASVTYNPLYASTLTPNATFPGLRGLVWFFSSGLCFPPLLIFAWLSVTGQAKRLPTLLHEQQAAGEQGVAIERQGLIGNDEAADAETRPKREESDASSSFEPPADLSGNPTISLHKV